MRPGEHVRFASNLMPEQGVMCDDGRYRKLRYKLLLGSSAVLGFFDGYEWTVRRDEEVLSMSKPSYAKFERGAYVKSRPPAKPAPVIRRTWCGLCFESVYAGQVSLEVPDSGLTHHGCLHLWDIEHECPTPHEQRRKEIA